MAKSLREVVGTNVVLGSFNPAIFQPAWFAKQGLLSAEEANGAEINRSSGVGLLHCGLA
jgi:hypothetical protein